MSETNVVATVVSKVSKSKLIKAAFKASKDKLDTPANDIVAAVKANTGADVTVSLVNNLKCRLRKSQAERKAAKETANAVGVSVGDLDKLKALRQFAESIGGLEELKRQTAALESALALAEKLKALTA